jgi:hypothetical protein
MRRHQGGRKQLFSPEQAPDLRPSARAVDEQIAKAKEAVACAVVAVSGKWQVRARDQRCRRWAACAPSVVLALIARGNDGAQGPQLISKSHSDIHSHA